MPHEIKESFFCEVPEEAEAKARRLARDAYMGVVSEAPPKRFALSERAREACTFVVEDLEGCSDADVARGGHGQAVGDDERFDLILCRYSILLYASCQAAAQCRPNSGASKLLAYEAEAGRSVYGYLAV